MRFLDLSPERMRQPAFPGQTVSTSVVCRCPDTADARIFLAENAWEELETWLLAGVDLPRDWQWADIRREVSVKEVYFAPLAELRGVANDPGRGRGPLGEEASRNTAAIQRKCPEDFGRLAQRIRAVLNPGNG